LDGLTSGFVLASVAVIVGPNLTDSAHSVGTDYSIPALVVPRHPICLLILNQDPNHSLSGLCLVADRLPLVFVHWKIESEFNSKTL
jgi:hypothetical protein